MTNCVNFTVEGLLECHKNASLSDPWPHSDAYIIFMHCMSVVTLGLFLFAAYCIQYKTINEAKFFARLQLVHLLWTTSTDLLLTSICTPIIFVPYYAGYFNGILSLLGMDPFLQTCLCLCSLIFLYVILCFVAYFWTRHLINKLPASSEKTKKMQKKANRALGLQVSVFLLLFSVPMVVFYFSGKVTENPLPGLSYFMFFIIFMASISDTSTMIGLNEGYRTTFLEKTRLDRFFKKKQLLVAPISNASSIPTDSP